MSPTARTREYLQQQGYQVDVTERWIPARGSGRFGVRKDLWGFVDLLAMQAGYPILAVQTTSGAHVADRIAKIRGLPAHEIWLNCGGRIQVIGWRKVFKLKPDGTRSRQKVWEPVVREIELE